MEEFNLDKLFNKEFYIVDCTNFVFYPREVRAVGFEISSEGTNIIIDEVDNLIHENRRFPIEYLEKYKSFEEAKKEAERLNNIPENKKNANEWNSLEAIYKRQLLEQSIKGEW